VSFVSLSPSSHFQEMYEGRDKYFEIWLMRDEYSFANPPPGQPVSKPLEDQSLKLGQKIDDLDHETARKNFRVVIIKPDAVEQVDLTNPDSARRWKYTYVGPSGDDESKGGWNCEELWP